MLRHKDPDWSGVTLKLTFLLVSAGEEQSSCRGSDHRRAAAEGSQGEGARASAAAAQTEDHRRGGAERLQTQEEEGERQPLCLHSNVQYQ